MKLAGKRPLSTRSFKTQFVVTFILVLVLSFVASIVTYLLGIRLYLNVEGRKVQPANYFEKQIPQIEAEIRELGPAVLQDHSRLEELVPHEGLLYQVLDEEGVVLCGTDREERIQSREELFRAINTTQGVGGRFFRTIPVFSPEGELVGGISLSYRLTPYFPRLTDKLWLLPLGYIVFFSPFLFIVLFTLLFARKFAKNIEEPMNVLIDAAQKVKEQDLNFEISYEGDNELGRLCASFNEMKGALRESLVSQWRLEQTRHEEMESLAHDLKTPFSLIQAYAEALLDKGTLVENEGRYLQVIANNARRGADMVGDLLYATELETMPLDLRKELVDVATYLKRKEDDYRVIAAHRGIDFQVHLNEQSWDNISVELDLPRLDRILDNILLNSLHYTQKNGTIKLEASVGERWIEFAVCDTGKGFSSEELVHLFDKFYRGDAARTRVGSSSGLGLFIAKRLVEKQGGTIKAFNGETGGACVQFVLPL